MARIHILDSPRAGEWNAAVHFIPPAGANKIGTTWKQILVEQYPNPEPLAGDAAEKAEIAAGNIIEISVVIELEPSAMTVPVAQVAIENVAAHAISEWVREPQRRFQYYGYSQGTVT